MWLLSVSELVMQASPELVRFSMWPLFGPQQHKKKIKLDGTEEVENVKDSQNPDTSVVTM